MIETETPIISRIHKYFTEDMIMGPGGLQHSGKYLLIETSLIDQNNQLSIRTFPPTYTIDEVVPLANLFNRRMTTSGRLKLQKIDTSLVPEEVASL